MTITAPAPKPQALTAPPAPTTPAPLAIATSEVGSSTAATTGLVVDSNPYPKSTLQSHEWLNGKSIKYQPISVMFLTGDYSGKVIDLGYNVQSLKESSSADWKPIDVRGVRGGIEFYNLSTTNLDFSVEFWSDNYNVRQLISNLNHLKEISGRDKTPPLLQIKIGGDAIDSWVCTKVDSDCSNPLPGGAGFRRGTANLSFILVGGQNTRHGTGRPLGSTPMSDIARTTSEAAKARAGELTRVNSLLTNCVSSQGIEQINKLSEDNKLNDPTAIAALPNDALVSLAISGSISPEVLADPAVTAKLSQGIAQRLSETEPGGNPSQFAELARSLQSGEPTGISGDIIKPGSDGSTQFERMVADYNLIKEAIQGQNLGTDSPVFDRNSNPSAGSRLNNFGSCGLSLRAVGGVSGEPTPPATTQDAIEQNAKLGNINQFFKENPSHEQLLVRFELPVDTDKEFSKCLISGKPFDKQKSFEDECTRCSGGRVNGRSLWSKFN